MMIEGVDIDQEPSRKGSDRREFKNDLRRNRTKEKWDQQAVEG